ncbi:GAF domain-containing protein [Pseudonocardia alni]|uniref:GAF domain-containing protein n=1 Tax=Pseudonocardia alni TaxID=33907 RepID=A0A852W3B5_PSEA5|nr:GAF domain-containing protein [Pseudonocardia antarctica]NYG00875.1 hypothetical protein [Pseudonocardia antarctica]
MNPERLGRLREQIHRDGDDEPVLLLNNLLHVALRECGVHSAGLTVVGGRPDARRDLVAVTGPLAELMENTQLTVGEGPCVDAVLGARPVLVPVMAGAPRWPAYEPIASENGVAAEFAFPLRTGVGNPLGVLDLFRTDPGDMSAEEHDGADLLVLLACEVLGRHVHRAEQWLPNSHGTVQIASGMVAAALDISPERGLLLMRARAYAEGTTLDDLARSIVGREVSARLDSSGSPRRLPRSCGRL